MILVTAETDGAQTFIKYNFSLASVDYYTYLQFTPHDAKHNKLTYLAVGGAPAISTGTIRTA